ncbi:succinylglutamate desuccinylase/aspartoacylase family protein [Myxococcota bacterium]|nr:succinylglutamate desuccinylase/aspartoacylase family protein [Myxococcota bacterium]
MMPLRKARILMALPFGLLLAASAALAAGPAKPWGPLELLDRKIAPGEKQKFSYARTRTFEAAYLNTAVFVSRGIEPGPTLCLTALIHGDERNGFEVARTAFDLADPKQLAGTLIALPAVNVNGFRSGSRYMPDRRDLNREFPGSLEGSNSGIIAFLLHQTATKVCDALIDLHTGSFERANLPQIRVDLSHPRALEMARAFGAPVVLGGEGPRGSFRREMMESGVPSIIYEAGLPLRFEPEEIERGVDGVRNVMHLLGMGPGRASAPTPPSRIFSRSSWIRVPMSEGGIFYPIRKLGDHIRAGDAVARIDEPFTDARFELRAPLAGTVIGMAVPQVVFSGYALVHVAQP